MRHEQALIHCGVAIAAVEFVLDRCDLGGMGIEYRDNLIDQIAKSLLRNVHVSNLPCAEIAQRRLARSGSKTGIVMAVRSTAILKSIVVFPPRAASTARGFHYLRVISSINASTMSRNLVTSRFQDRRSRSRSVFQAGRPSMVIAGAMICRCRRSS